MINLLVSNGFAYSEKFYIASHLVSNAHVPKIGLGTLFPWRVSLFLHDLTLIIIIDTLTFPVQLLLDDV